MSFARWDVAVIGSLNVDISMDVNGLPIPGETVHGHQIRRNPGGKGANQAVAAANFGARVALIGAVGDDPDGQYLLEAIGGRNVSTEHIVRLQRVATGAAYIVVDADGQNTIVVIGGANLALTCSVPRASALVYLAQLESPIAALEKFFSQAPEGSIRILNGAPANRAAHKLFPLIDVLILNEPELAAFAEINSVDSIESAREAAEAIRTSSHQTIIVTLGARGALAITHDNCFVHRAPTVLAVDATGAGDCFCGVFAAELAAGTTIDDATRHAVAAASIAVTRKGAIPSMPFRHEVAQAG